MKAIRRPSGDQRGSDTPAGWPATSTSRLAVGVDDPDLVAAGVGEPPAVGRPLRVGDVLLRGGELDRAAAAERHDDELAGAGDLLACRRRSGRGGGGGTRAASRPRRAARSSARRSRPPAVAPDARAPRPSARVIDPPRSAAARGRGGGRCRPAEPGRPRPDHRVMGADVAVEILVRPAEPFGIEPLVVGHRRGSPLGAGRRRRRSAARSSAGGVPRAARTWRSLNASTPSGGIVRPARRRPRASRAPGRPRRTSPRGGRRGRRTVQSPSGRRRPAPRRDASVISRLEVGEDRLASSAQNRADRRGEVRADRLRVGPERIVADLAVAQRVGPRLEDA